MDDDCLNFCCFDKSEAESLQRRKCRSKEEIYLFSQYDVFTCVVTGFGVLESVRLKTRPFLCSVEGNIRFSWVEIDVVQWSWKASSKNQVSCI